MTLFRILFKCAQPRLNKSRTSGLHQPYLTMLTYLGILTCLAGYVLKIFASVKVLPWLRSC